MQKQMSFHLLLPLPWNKEGKESWELQTCMREGSGSPPGLVWHNAGSIFRNHLKLHLAALTVLALPSNWTLPTCSGIFLADRKVIMFLNVCWILGYEYILSLCNMIANSEKGRNFVLWGRSGQDSLNISGFGQAVQLLYLSWVQEQQWKELSELNWVSSFLRVTEEMQPFK